MRYTPPKAKSGGKSIGGMQACGAKAGGGAKVSGHIPGSALVPWQEVAIRHKVGNVELIDEIPETMPTTASPATTPSTATGRARCAGRSIYSC